jgi:hypothetical protein
MEGSRKIRRNKRYGWLLFFTILNWAVIGLMVLFTDPESMRDIIIPNSYLPMGVLMFGGLFLIFSILFLSSMRAIKWAVAVMIFVYLRLYGLGSLINGILLFGVVVSWDIYSTKIKGGSRKDGEDRPDLIN